MAAPGYRASQVDSGERFQWSCRPQPLIKSRYWGGWLSTCTFSSHNPRIILAQSENAAILVKANHPGSASCSLKHEPSSGLPPPPPYHHCLNNLLCIVAPLALRLSLQLGDVFASHIIITATYLLPLCSRRPVVRLPQTAPFQISVVPLYLQASVCPPLVVT